MAKSYGTIAFHGRSYRVTPGAVTAMQRDPGNMLRAYELLRLEGYTTAELDAVAQVELFPSPRPAEQLPLFEISTTGNPWR
jgi:hypothetical protein